MFLPAVFFELCQYLERYLHLRDRREPGGGLNGLSWRFSFACTSCIFIFECFSKRRKINPDEEEHAFLVIVYSAMHSG